ncbi:MAG: phage major capsid protein [Firmicutes bacterium]|nr:phage major capsid protein [Bacillota bacterium]
MALKALLQRKRIDLKKKERDEKRAALDELEKRESDLEIAIREVSNEDEQAAVQEEVDNLITEKEQLEAVVADLDQTIADLENELSAMEAEQGTEPPDEDKARAKEPAKEERSVKPMNESMITRDRVFRGMTRAEQEEMIKREGVQTFLGAVRDVLRSRSQGGHTRAINNIGLTIPQEFLGILRQNVLDYSKLTRHITVQNVNGEGRVLITGDIPEAVWTECCANLNELTIGFFQDAFGCWKLGGFFVICNANLEDSDLDMAAELLTTLGQSLAYTDDKTYIYGNGTSMPMGIVTRLAQESQPAGYPATARPWADLHTSNIKTIANTYTGLNLFQQLVLAAGAAKGKYARGEKVWVMNEFTYNFLMAQAMNVDAAGAIVSQVNGTMPVIGGIIEVLPDTIIPDYNIVMGYFELYRRVNRAGVKYASSDEYFFLSDQTVFKATERWDGKPLIAEAFVLIGINGTSPTTSATFVGDGANEPQALILPATASVAVGGKLTLKPTILPYGVNTTFSWASATTAKATISSVTGEITGVSTGSSVITVTADNGLTAQTTVTVVAAD